LAFVYYSFDGFYMVCLNILRLLYSCLCGTCQSFNVSIIGGDTTLAEGISEMLHTESFVGKDDFRH